MHVKNRNATVDNFHVQVCKDISDSSAASLVNLSKLASLEEYACIVHYLSKVSDILCISIIAAALSASTGILIECEASSTESTVLSLIYLWVIWIKCSTYVR